MTEFSSNLTFDKQETTVLASRVPGGSASASDELEHALRATSIEIVVDARSSAGGTLVLTAEESDDGESWSEIDAVGTLTRTGSASLTVTPSKEWLRVSWTGGGGWTIDVTATGHATIEAGNIASSGGGSSTLSVIGPFTLNWDDTNVNNGPTLVADLAVGTTVIQAWGIVTESWVTDEGDPFEFSMDVGDATDNSETSFTVVDYPAAAGIAYQGDGGGIDPTTIVHRTAVIYASGWHLWVSVWVNGSGTLSSGSIDFYAQVNVPA